MKYYETITLKNGKEAILRNGTAQDGSAVYDVFTKTHGETDFLLSYPEENSFNEEEEAAFLEEKTNSTNEIEILALVEGRIVGTAGIGSIGKKVKVRHRAEFGISVLKEFWGLGIGGALTKACIKCAREAGYTQLELNAVSENNIALALYKKAGFVEFGRNPRGFNSKISGYQEVLYMRLEL